MSKDSPPRKFSPLRVFALLFQMAGALIVIAVPLLGAWVASSLAAYANGPVWIALASGLLFFPILPLAWDAWANVRARRKEKKKPPRFTTRDRLILRTMFTSVVLLALVLALAPKATFTALSTRGDWMLEGRSEPWAGMARKVLFTAADQLEWVYVAVKENPYAKYADRDDERVDRVVTKPVEPPRDAGVSPVVDASRTSTRTAEKVAQPAPQASPDSGVHEHVDPANGVTEYAIHGTPPPPAATSTHAATEAPAALTNVVQTSAARTSAAAPWPMQASLHPLVRDLPKHVESSPAAVARYIAEHEPDHLQRIKALHDWVADRIAYDAEALAEGRYPPQDAETVFTARKAVCAGYTRLFAEMMHAAGEEAISIAGQARQSDRGVDGGGHAWNVVKLDGAWYLVDVTWDSGHVNGKRFVKDYRTVYFLTPPDIFGLTHFPDKPKWQLVGEPLSRGDFIRQPMLQPEFFARKLKLTSPARSQISAENGAVQLVLDNPGDASLMATFSPLAAGIETGKPCNISYTLREARVTCTFEDPGTYRVSFFAADEELGAHRYVGHIEVQNRS